MTLELKSIAVRLGLNKVPLLTRLYNSIAYRKLPDVYTIVPCHGFQMLVHPPRRSIIGRSIYLTGVWEPEATRIASQWVKPGMSAVDIGAETGYYTLLFAKLVGPEGQVYSFEPRPSVKQRLDRNVEMNRLNNVRTFPFALFDLPGTAYLEEGNDMLLLEKPPTGGLEVGTRVFDQWMADEGINGVDLIKLDVEGAELNILKGMEKTLAKSRPAILVEVHPDKMRGFGCSPTDLVLLLSNYGYSLEPVDRERIDFLKGDITLFCQKGES